jgi:hypothetical protein
MYPPEGRAGRRPSSVKLIAAALSIALMGMAGVALAAPTSDPGPPPQAQGNGPAPQAQLGPPPQAQAPAPPAAKPKTTGQHGGGKQVQAPAAQLPQAGAQSNPGTSVAPGHEGGHRGRPAPGEVRGRGHARSNARSSGCQAARCQGGTPSTGDEQPADGGVVLGVTDERPGRDRAGRGPGEAEPGAALEWAAVQGLNQGGGEVAYAPPESFDGALPFTGFELVLLAAIGTLLGLAGVWLRRLTA